MHRAKRVVQSGYDQISERWANTPYPTDHVRPWIDQVTESLQPGALILDLGCGAGNVEIVRLARRFRLLCVDISRTQLRTASRRMPSADAAQADMGAFHLRPASIDAIVALYSIIHLPREEHQPLFASASSWLKPGAHALFVLGANDTPSGYEGDWFGAPMYWTHFDAETNLRMLRKAGFQIIASAIERDPIDVGAQLFAICRAG